jgi:cytochrome b
MNDRMPTEPGDADDTELVPVPVWDIWVRLFHWALVVVIAASFITDQVGDLDSHYIAGLAVLGLVIFRILWGLVGSPTARFTHFIRGPRAILAYLKYALGRRPSFSFGHNPAGAAMVAVLLFLLLMQAISGLFNTDDILFEGPLYDNASSAITGFMGSWHARFGNAILALILLHVVVVLLYRLVKGENLVRAMIFGKARLPRPVATAVTRSGEAKFASPLKAILCAAIAAAVPLAIHSLN